MDLSILILLAVICVVISVLIGFLLATALGGKSTAPPPQAKQEGLDRLISFWTDKSLRQIVPQIDGKTIKAPALLKEDERRQLILLYQELGKWLNLTPASQAIQQEEGSKQTTASQATAINPADLPLSSNEKPPKKGVADWLAEAVQPKVSVSEPARSIAMQVDEILQRRLQEKGWQQRGIRLLELPNKGMVVMIGLDQYATVEDVPDAEIQAILRASVREWEAKMYGG